jgi:hypothetical protein
LHPSIISISLRASSPTALSICPFLPITMGFCPPVRNVKSCYHAGRGLQPRPPLRGGNVCGRGCKFRPAQGNENVSECKSCLFIDCPSYYLS